MRACAQIRSGLRKRRSGCGRDGGARQYRSMPVALPQSVALAAAGAVLGLVVNAVRPDGVALLHPWASEVEGTAECAVAAVSTRIGIDEARRLQETHAAVFGDVRGAAEYAAGHVTDSVHLPCSADVPAWLAAVGKSSTVVLYGADDSDAEPVAQSLRASGYQDVRVLSGGFAAWRASGGSAASGPCEACS